MRPGEIANVNHRMMDGVHRVDIENFLSEVESLVEFRIGRVSVFVFVPETPHLKSTGFQICGNLAISLQ